MQPTRRSWAVGGLATLLAAAAVVFARPLLFVGAAQVGAWLLARQYRFVRDVDRTVDSLSVKQTPARTALATDATVPVDLTANLEEPSPLDLEVEAGLPTAAAPTERPRVRLEPDARSAGRSVAVAWPVAGTHPFDEATVTARDGTFRQTAPAGETPTVTVEPPGPRSVHVGRGGDRSATVYGKHRDGRFGSGTEPAELREYAPGDTADRIDWNATARLATPYVRKYESETSRPTLLVVDHRATLDAGPRARRKLDYLREVALAVASRARRHDDPLGLLAVDEGGITRDVDWDPKRTTAARIRRLLLDLEPSPAGDGERAAGTTPAAGSAAPSGASRVDGRRDDRPTAADARRTLAELDGVDDAFARRLRPYYADRERSRTRLERNPLATATERTLGRRRGPVRTVLFTDDSRPAELRETAKLARRYGTVDVYLAPTVLYERGPVGNVERAYDRYVDFERLRRSLERMERVTAFEVGPSDRVATLLDAGRSARGGRA